MGACSPKEFLDIRCSEIASEAIFGQKQSRSSYMAHRAFHPIFGCPCMHLLRGVSNRWNGIWNGTVEWKMEWNGEYT